MREEADFVNNFLPTSLEGLGVSGIHTYQVSLAAMYLFPTTSAETFSYTNKFQGSTIELKSTDGTRLPSGFAFMQILTLLSTCNATNKRPENMHQLNKLLENNVGGEYYNLYKEVLERLNSAQIKISHNKKVITKINLSEAFFGKDQRFLDGKKVNMLANNKAGKKFFTEKTINVPAYIFNAIGGQLEFLLATHIIYTMAAAKTRRTGSYSFTWAELENNFARGYDAKNFGKFRQEFKKAFLNLKRVWAEGDEFPAELNEKGLTISRRDSFSAVAPNKRPKEDEHEIFCDLSNADDINKRNERAEFKKYLKGQLLAMNFTEDEANKLIQNNIRTVFCLMPWLNKGQCSNGRLIKNKRGFLLSKIKNGTSYNTKAAQRDKMLWIDATRPKINEFAVEDLLGSLPEQVKDLLANETRRMGVDFENLAPALISKVKKRIRKFYKGNSITWDVFLEFMDFELTTALKKLINPSDNQGAKFWEQWFKQQVGFERFSTTAQNKLLDDFIKQIKAEWDYFSPFADYLVEAGDLAGQPKFSKTLQAFRAKLSASASEVQKKNIASIKMQKDKIITDEFEAINIQYGGFPLLSQKDRYDFSKLVAGIALANVQGHAKEQINNLLFNNKAEAKRRWLEWLRFVYSHSSEDYQAANTEIDLQRELGAILLFAENLPELFKKAKALLGE